MGITAYPLDTIADDLRVLLETLGLLPDARDAADALTDELTDAVAGVLIRGGHLRGGPREDPHENLRDDASRAAFYAATPTGERLTWTTTGESVVAHPIQEFDIPTRVVRVDHRNCWATSCFRYRLGPMNYLQPCTRREIREPIDSRPHVLVIRENGDTTLLPAAVLIPA